MEGLSTRELAGRSFACLEGCGFCCTFQPEASKRELALLRARVAPKPLPVVVGEGRSYLALQSGCGACTLLERRECQAYDLRPAHCRYFPFHVHFGARPEVYVNETCRGVARAEGGDLRAAFDASVLVNVKRDEWDAQARAGREAYAQFQRHAQKAGAWGDAREVAERALAERDALTRAWMERAIAAADEDVTPDEMARDALAPFSAPDITKRPFYLAPDLRWLTFDGAARVVEMDERGALAAWRRIEAPEGWQDLPPALTQEIIRYLRELAARDLFAGSVYAVVDDLGYATSVEEATWWRLAELAADLTVRARILAQLDVPESALAGEVRRFFDSTFLDSSSIGGFL